MINLDSSKVVLMVLGVNIALYQSVGSRNLKCAAPFQCSELIKCNLDQMRLLGHSVFHRCTTHDEKVCCVPIGPTATTTTTTTTTTTIRTTPAETTTISFVDSDKEKKLLLPMDTCGQRLTAKTDYTFDSNKIYKGTAASLGEVPWIVLLRIKEIMSEYEEMCGGTLISSRYIVTAAHCLYGDYDSSNVRIMLGGVNINKMIKCFNKPASCEDPVPVRRIGRAILHKKYNPNTSENDIALVRMDPVEFTAFIQPACLPFEELGDKLMRKENSLLTAGWGRKGENSRGSNILQRTNQYVVPNDDCVQNFKDLGYDDPILKSQVCTQGKDNSRALKGDSGGPLLVEEIVSVKQQKTIFVLVGVNSFGPTNWNRKDAAPTVYTRVSKYLGWILRNIAP